MKIGSGWHSLAIRNREHENEEKGAEETGEGREGENGND